MDEFFRSVFADWPLVMAHPEAFFSVLAIGLIFGWVAAWIVLKQRLAHHRDLVDHYKEIVAEKIPPSAPIVSRRFSGLVSFLAVVGSAFILVGAWFAYDSPEKMGIPVIVMLLGLMLVIFAIALFVNPTLTPIEKRPKGPLV